MGVGEGPGVGRMAGNGADTNNADVADKVVADTPPAAGSSIGLSSR